MQAPQTGPFRFTLVAGLVGACLLVYLLQMSGQVFLIEHFALWPPGPRPLQYAADGVWRLPDFQIWQPLTYAFLHGSPMHLLLNMFGLWMFGRAIEQALGTLRFAIFYTVCVLGAAAAQILVAQYTHDIVPTIGASGGVLGLLPAFAILFPQARIQLIIPPVNLRAPVFVLLYGVVELLLGATNTLPSIAHFAHLGGMLCGGLLLWFWLAQARAKQRRG